ncbi:MAG: Cof-type HAD-IIB family hydrolase [Propionicimonas sp.]|uniref:Cof-type HAD-IIB family hydrolase n=1 Tax=Propionicimonas sp. TaxID=1955623 RepID=UPI003D0C8B5A
MTVSVHPRVVLLDIDGTLLNYRAELPASAAAAVCGARANGHKVYLCTGRSRAEVYPELWDLGVDGLIGGNGSYVEDAGRVVFHQAMDADVVARAIAWLDERALGYYLECNAGLFASANLPEAAAVAIGRPGADGEAFVRGVFAGMHYGTVTARADVNKISFALVPGLDLDGLAREFAGRARIDTWSATGTGPEFGEFGQFGIHKGAAVERLAAHLGVPLSDLIGVGDARSDLELLTTCGTGVAMGNAPEELKAVADLVTDHVDDDGLAHAFAALGLV